MWTETYYVMALATSLLCVVVVGITVIRLGLCCGHLRPRFKYTAVILSSFIGAAQPYINSDMPGIGCVALAVCILILLIDGTPPFRNYKNKNNFFETQVFDSEFHGED